MTEPQIPDAAGEFLLYSSSEGEVRVSVYCEGETAWLPQKAMAELFGVQVPAVAKHLKNIFDSGELAENAVVSISETAAADAKTYKTRHYSLDAIIAVGYRALEEFNRIISAYLDLAENRAQRGILMLMADWAGLRTRLPKRLRQAWGTWSRGWFLPRNPIGSRR